MSDRNRLNRLRGRRRTLVAAAAVGLGTILRAETAGACDMHSVYSAVEVHESAAGLRVGLAEQYTHFGLLNRDGHSVANPADERLDSSVTQLVLRYDPRADWGVQLNLPLISRHFRRQTADGIEHGDENGFGDMSLLVRYRPIDRDFDLGTVRVSLLAGLTVPTGSADRLREESEEESGSHLRDGTVGWPRHLHPDEVASGVHGHDLALGSGAVDALFGGEALWLFDRLYVVGSLQYRLRNRGSHDYEYADQINASAGPGYFVWVGGGATVALHADVSVDTKGKDRLGESVLNDTALTALFAGPGLHVTYRGATLEIGGDIPVVRNNSDLQIVPSYRLDGALTYHF